MAFPAPSRLLILCILLLFVNTSPYVRAQLEETSLKLMRDAFEWPTTTMSSLYNNDEVEEEEDEGEDNMEGGLRRRSLFWQSVKYYISYGALAANRIPCPPRSGRSYYTHDCFKASGPVHPYTRGCSRITLCRR
ncbi:protein RALF-like 34 [Fagus crenata]